MATYFIFVIAALAEIAGCFACWSWLRLGKSALWLVPGVASLMLFAFLLAHVDSDSAGRTFASYGGVYITASLSWIWAVEGRTPDRWDLLGGAICLIGTAVILWAPRST